VSSRKRGRGRPRLPKGEARGAVLSVRLTVAERAAIEWAAEATGQSTSDWARAAILGAAALRPAAD
jgi:hypothetical protein